MWIVILISFIMYGIWQFIQMPYFFLKTFFKKHYSEFRVGMVSYEEETFHGRFDITRRPTGFTSSYDYFKYAKPLVLKAQGNKETLYYAYGALKFSLNQSLTITYEYDNGEIVSANREDIHNALIFPLYLMYFTRIGCSKIQFECNRLRENVLRLSTEHHEEGFFNGFETIGFSDAINIGLDGEAPSWSGHVSKGIIACAIVAIMESKCVLKHEKRRMKWVYRILKSRNIFASIYPFMTNEHRPEDLDALIASYEVLLDYDNNLFYRIGYKKLMKVHEETKCHYLSQTRNTLKSKEALKLQSLS